MIRTLNDQSNSIDLSKEKGNIEKKLKTCEEDECMNSLFMLNRHLQNYEDDVLYHLSLGKRSHDLKKMFGDVKFVCMGGSAKRMLKFALYVNEFLQFGIPEAELTTNISESADRYAMYKIGPILSVNHGMGCPTLSILLNELIKLIHYAGCKDVIFFRMGTCGGLGIEPGTIIVSEKVVDGMFREASHEMVLGKEVVRPTKCNVEIIDELVKLGNNVMLLDKNNNEKFDVKRGKTMCANDFYEGQARLDGAFCDFSPEDKKKFLEECFRNGITNFEMESLGFSSILNRAQIKFAIVCVTIIDRLRGDSITISHERNVEFQERPFFLVAEFIRQRLSNKE